MLMLTCVYVCMCSCVYMYGCWCLFMCECMCTGICIGVHAHVNVLFVFMYRDEYEQIECALCRNVDV